MHSTARHLNLIRRLNAWALALAIPGAPRAVLLSDDRSAVGEDATVRWTLTPLQGVYAGRYGASAAAFDSTALLTADLFWPTGDTRSVSSAYAIDAAADFIKDAASRLILPWLDYSTDASNPTTTADAYIECTEIPEVRNLGPSDGYSRRQVLIPLRWMQAEADPS